MYPLARTTDLIIEELPSETVVYDKKRNRVHCLNQAASLILRHCDGQTSVDEIARLLSHAVGVPADANIVRLGLRDLNDCDLLEAESASLETVPRRELLNRLSALGAAFICLFPVVTSITAPTPAMAKSHDAHDTGKGGGKGKGH